VEDKSLFNLMTVGVKLQSDMHYFVNGFCVCIYYVL